MAVKGRITILAAALSLLAFQAQAVNVTVVVSDLRRAGESGAGGQYLCEREQRHRGLA